MPIIRLTYDEGLVLYEDTEGEVQVDIPADLYEKWRDLIAALAQVEHEIAALCDAQNPPAPPPTPRPAPPLAVPTGAVPVPRHVAEWLLAQEGG